MPKNRKQAEVTTRRLADGRYRTTVNGHCVIAANKERAVELAIELAECSWRLTTPATTGRDFFAGRM